MMQLTDVQARFWAIPSVCRWIHQYLCTTNHGPAWYLRSQTATLENVTGFEYPALSVPLEHLIKTQCLPSLRQQNVTGWLSVRTNCQPLTMWWCMHKWSPKGCWWPHASVAWPKDWDMSFYMCMRHMQACPRTVSLLTHVSWWES